jgi:heme-degrading monooxygenase HmoA
VTVVIVMRINVAPGREAEFERLVAERARERHQATPGFERMYLLRPRGQSEYRLVSWWQHLADPEAWVRKETYAFSEHPQHAGIVVGPVPHEVLDIARQFEPNERAAAPG